MANLQKIRHKKTVSLLHTAYAYPPAVRSITSPPCEFPLRPQAAHSVRVDPPIHVRPLTCWNQTSRCRHWSSRLKNLTTAAQVHRPLHPTRYQRYSPGDLLDPSAQSSDIALSRIEYDAARDGTRAEDGDLQQASDVACNLPCESKRQMECAASWMLSRSRETNIVDSLREVCILV